ncbi:MAG: hypothetical protein IRZ16_14535 [Myxococcaceae bacterium]|nr:hypothetical protein [Myxococcaceae bacterium]
MPDQDEAAARREFDAAQREYDLGRFEQAIEHYSRAYEAMPLPELLFNIAQCHRHLRRYDRAAFFYRRYLDLAGAPPNAALTRELLEEMERRQKEQEVLERATAQNAARALAPQPKSAPEPATPLHRRWYVWAAAAGVVAATAAVVALTVAQPPPPTLGTIRGR